MSLRLLPSRSVVRGLVPLLCAVAVGCTDRKLVPVEQELPDVVDDLVDIEAEFCTRPVEDVKFPVKLLLVVDTSGSLQFTDQSGLRRAAIRELMSNLSTQNDLRVATIGFGSNVNIDPPIVPDGDLFVDAASWVEPPFIGLADVQTNYHGALAAVKSHVLADLLSSDPAEISRTKYIIIFFSDGSPTPKCCITADEQCLGGQCPDDADNVTTTLQMPYGCAPEAFETFEPGLRYCEGEPEQSICNDQGFLDRFRGLNPGAAPPAFTEDEGVLEALNELEPNDNYNRVFQNEDLVKDIMELGEQFGVGEMRFHTALLFDSTLPDDVKEIFRLNRCRSEGLLRRMAEIGNGIFRDFENSEEIDFLSFNFTSLKQSFKLMRAYAQNVNALPPREGGDVAKDVVVLDFLPDSDGDGLDDVTELELGTDVADKDSDKLLVPPSVTQVPEPIQDPNAWGDGYADLFEARRLNIGFDPRFKSLPVDICVGFDAGSDPVDQQDLDADGLNGCEENLLGSDPERVDTDGDGLPDGIEFRFGLDPNVNEGNRDDDFDGLPNADEVVKGLDPLLPDEDRRDRAGVRYELINTGETDDGRTCYKSIARGVHLANTAPRFLGGRSGYNDVLYWIAEAPSDAASRVEMRVACHRAQYLKPSFKDPANSKITFTEADFVDLSDPATIQRIADGEDLCKGLEVR
jgi:hypothetical protein